jgi:hypothetical protein
MGSNSPSTWGFDIRRALEPGGERETHERHVEDDAVERQPTEKITGLFYDLLEFPAFKTAPVLSSILLFLWTHQGESVTEYAIAVDALGRTPSFDPKSDASGRVLIGRLGARLKEFYEAESYPLKLSIPIGTHEIHWVVDDRRPDQVLPAAPPPLVVVPGRSGSSSKF